MSLVARCVDLADRPKSLCSLGLPRRLLLANSENNEAFAPIVRNLLKRSVPHLRPSLGKFCLGDYLVNPSCYRRLDYLADPVVALLLAFGNTLERFTEVFGTDIH